MSPCQKSGGSIRWRPAPLRCRFGLCVVTGSAAASDGAACILDIRDRRYIRHQISEMAIQRSFTIASFHPLIEGAHFGLHPYRPFHPDFPPFCLQPPHESRDGFLMLPLSLTGVSVPSQEPPFGLRHSLTGSPTSCGRIEFVLLTDWRFSSSCFPPGLTATQFNSDTDRRASV